MPGEISYLYIASINANPLSDWTSQTEINERVNNSGHDINSFRKLTVVGDMPLPTSNEIPISADRLAEIKTSRVINFDIDEVTKENYEFLQSTETTTGLHCRVWIETAAGVRFGSNEGIIGRLKIRPLLARGSTEIEKYIGTFKWNSLVSPGRYDQNNAQFENIITDDEDDVHTDGDDLIFT